MVQGTGRGLGSLHGDIGVLITENGFILTMRGGSDIPHMPFGRNAVYNFLCDKKVRWLA
jgi:hypothetical protein